MAKIQTGLVTPVNIPAPPAEYDQGYMLVLIDIIEKQARELNTVRKLYATTINCSSLPTSSAGLRTGDFWNSTGTVKVA